MIKKFPPINPRIPHMLHGGDYNPDQWPEDIWDEDIRLMKLASCNTMAVGIFSWVNLEPIEGHYDFAWLDKIMDKLLDNDCFAILATPSGARPAWLSQKYPEVLRVRPERLRNLHGTRHNHCMTSPVYRQKTKLINRALAERYKTHPALITWHISNEYSGECHCDLCQDAFRNWLKLKYQNNLDALNHAWWTAFWSHTYTDWSQIESPSPVGEMVQNGLNLDWKRFSNDQTFSFFLNEIEPLRELTPDVPITTNFMGLFSGINYPKFAQYVDVISWDSYPIWHTSSSDWELGAYTSFIHDQNRSMKNGQPFMLMESAPSISNWQPVPKLKRPGMHKLSSLQAVAHGSDTVQYFQWRKSRGGPEKYHGAVVDHVGHEHTRIFRDVAEVGEILKKLDSVIGTSVQPEVAIIFDWENRWAIDGLQGLGNDRRNYVETAIAHYLPFWKLGIPVDVIAEEAIFTPYKMVIAPMLYMIKPGVAERLTKFVENGGTLVATYWSGIVDENDLCFLGGWPGNGLRKLFGIWDEEIDTLNPEERVTVKIERGVELGLKDAYTARDYFALIHAEGAQVLATFGNDFFAGRPALTVNNFGNGQAYYVASRNDSQFLDDFFFSLTRKLKLSRNLEVDLPIGVTAQMRTDGENKFLFIMNFNSTQITLNLNDKKYTDLISGTSIKNSLLLEP